MVPALSRRRLLAASGALAAALGTGPALAGTASSPGQSDGWPMAQHDPAGTGHAPSARPPRDGVAVRWKRPLDPDRGFAYGATPVVADGRVYAVGEELLVLDAATGAVRLRADRDVRSTPAVAPARAYTSPTLAVAEGERVTGLHANGGLELLGSEVGLRRWSVSRDRHRSLVFDAGGVQTPPVAAGRTVLFSTVGGLLAVDASSGAVRWRADVDPSRPAVRDGTVYAADYGRGIRGYDLETGERTLRASVPGTLALSVTAGPDQLVVATDDGLAGTDYDGTTRWQFAPDDLYRDRGAVALADGVAYGGFRGAGEDDWLVAVDVTDGTERWRSPAVPESTPRFAPPAVAHGVVYVPVEDEGLVAVDAADGSVRWRFDPDDLPRPWSPVALVGDALYALGSEYVYALEEA